MKLKFIYALAIAGAMTTFTSCSSEDDPVAPGSSLEQKTYSSEDGLTLNLNGAPLVGKTVTFTPGTDGKATVTLAGEPLDISMIMGMIMPTKAEQGAPAIPTAGVLPGSPSVSIPVELKGDAENCTFEGNGETDYCTYSYSGSATADTFEFNLSDVKLKNTSLAGTWTVSDFLDDPEDPNSGKYYNITRLIWESEKQAQIELFPGFSMEMPIKSVLVMALGLEMLKQEDGSQICLLQMLNNVLHNVTFGEDGSVTAKYLDVETGEITVSPAGLAQYVVTSDNTIRLFLNPAAIIANTVTNAVVNTKAKTRATDITIVVEDLMQQLIPMLTEGINVSYGPAIDGEEQPVDGATAFYLDTKTLLPLLKAIAPLMSDETFVDSILGDALKDPALGSMSGMIPGVLKSFPDIINSTSKIEIGINLKK